MRVFIFAFVIFFTCSAAWAQDLPPKTVDKKFIIANGFLVGTTVFDIETTFRGLENCPSCKELNPLMRPFINSGRPATYFLEMSVDTIVIGYSYKLKKDGNKLWWVLPVVIGAGHGIAGSSNLKFSAKFTF